MPLPHYFFRSLKKEKRIRKIKKIIKKLNEIHQDI